LCSHPAFSQINIVASTTDLKSIVDAVGGDKVKTFSIARGNQNIHSVEVLPSYIMKITKAKMYVKIGMGLDQWADPLIDGARNENLVVIDCSKEIHKLDVPNYKVDASHGDVHPYGNPHYWLDPKNGTVVAKEILDALIRLSPDDRSYFEQRYEDFKQLIQSKTAQWGNLMALYRGSKIVVYHDDWRYFAEAFGFDIVGFVEPKPGLEPTPSHLYKLTNIIKKENVKLIGYQPYFSDQAPNSLAAETGAKAVKLATSVGCVDGVLTYTDIFDYNLKTMIAIIRSGN
jgi:ABC-type Zn uptake system ZnuABC Zn-binding protein ZnuA